LLRVTNLQTNAKSFLNTSTLDLLSWH